MWQWLNLDKTELNCILLLCLNCFVLSLVMSKFSPYTYCHIPFNCQPPFNTWYIYSCVVMDTPPLLYVVHRWSEPLARRQYRQCWLKRERKTLPYWLTSRLVVVPIVSFGGLLAVICTHLLKRE